MMLDYSKDPDKNLLERIDIHRRCKDKQFAAETRERCSRDILFWVNSFLWTYDPRKIKAGQNPHIPFITWPFQDEVLLTLIRYIGQCDVGIEKSRDMGASWMCLLVFLHQWQFREGRAFMMVSRNERLVDSSTDPDALFWKLDYLIERQPTFLIGEKDYERTKLHLKHCRTGSYIDGASTTADVGRGGRRTAVLLDEFGAFEVADSHAANAATASNTDCRIFNSTYKGAVGSFYSQLNERDDIVKLRIHWSQHPEHAAGLYVGGNGKQRSPWYDAKCKALQVPGLIAQELDIDPQGAASMFFKADLLDRLLVETVRSPFEEGSLEYGYDPRTPQWSAHQGGPLQLWLRLQEASGWKPPPGETYVVGCDISAGTGATNSVASVADCRTREKVAQFTTANLSPDKFADAVLALCSFFNGAYLIWEANGPVGQGFGKRILELKYRNIYYKRDEKGLEGKVATALIPGWHSNAGAKFALFQEYASSLETGSFLNRSRQAIQECRQYVYLVTGGIVNARSQAIADPSGARENHGDMPTADALASKALGSEPAFIQKDREDPNSIEGPCEPYSRKWRMQKWLREEQQKENGWETNEEWESSLAGW